MADKALGYLYEHPDAIASQTSDKHWRMEWLMEGVPYKAPPPSFLCPDTPPAALDQNGLGACVAFAGCTIKQAQEHADWNEWRYVSGTWTGTSTSTGAFRAYYDLKNGYGQFPGDGIPNAEGSYPEALWKLARLEGLPDKTGKRHVVSAYYSHSFASDTDLAFLQAVLMEYGPVNIASPWPGNWMSTLGGPNYFMRVPNSPISGHSYTIVGWETINGIVYLVCQNSWGTWGSGVQGLFRVPASWYYDGTYGLGPQIIWKTVDFKEAPTPPPPDPGDKMLTVVDRKSRLVDSSVGKTLYKMDGTTVLTTIKAGALNLASPAALTDGQVPYYAVVVSSGGVLQLATIKAEDCTNVRLTGGDVTAAVAAEKKKWTDWLGTAPA